MNSGIWARLGDHNVWTLTVLECRLRSEGVWSPHTPFQASNDVRRRFRRVYPADIIKINVYRTSPFWRDVDAPFETLIGPPIEHHEEVLIREYVAELNG